MKRLLLVAVLAAAAFFGYRTFRSSGPEAQYQLFAEEILHRRYDTAAAMTDGLTEKQLAKVGSQEQIGPGPEMFQTLFPSKYIIDSSETAADGTVTLHSTQTVLFNPAGVESAVRPAMFAKLAQVTQPKKGSGGWKVTSFENRFLEMDSTSKR
jgi:hypothetical protein